MTPTPRLQDTASTSPTAGIGDLARWCRPHHRRAIASRRAGSGSAIAGLRCTRARNARLLGSRRALRTADHSPSTMAVAAASNSAAMAWGSSSRPSPSNDSKPARARAQAAPAAPACYSLASARRQACASLTPAPRPSMPSHFALDNTRSAARALSQAHSACRHARRIRAWASRAEWNRPRPCSSGAARGIGRGPSPGHVGDRPGDPPGPVGGGESQGGQGGHLGLPGRRRAVVGDVATHRGQAGWLDKDQGQSPPKRPRPGRPPRRAGHTPGRLRPGSRWASWRG